MSYDEAHSKFSRLLSPTLRTLDADGRVVANGGLAALPDENPNGASAADVDVADAPLGTIGTTPAGVLWQKVSDSAFGDQWAPLGQASGGDFTIGFQLTAEETGTPVSRAWIAPFACEIIGFRTYSQDETNFGSYSIATTTGTYTSTVIPLSGSAAGIPITAAGAITVPDNRLVAPGEAVSATYADTAGGSGNLNGTILWVTLRATAPLITNT